MPYSPSEVTKSAFERRLELILRLKPRKKPENLRLQLDKCAEDRGKDIKELIEWSETGRSTTSYPPRPKPVLLAQVNAFAVSGLVPKQMFLDLAASDLRAVSKRRFFVSRPEQVARRYAECICREHLEGEAISHEPTQLLETARDTSAEMPCATQPSRNAIEGHRPSDRDIQMANRKCADPSKYPTMTAREIAARVGISLQSVYEHPGLEKVNTGTRKRLWTTVSVNALQTSPVE